MKYVVDPQNAFCGLGWHMRYVSLVITWWHIPRHLFSKTGERSFIADAWIILWLSAYTTATATATQSLSNICDLHHSSGQHRILNPLSEARDQTHMLMDPSRVHQPLSYKGNSRSHTLNPAFSLWLCLNGHWLLMDFFNILQLFEI